MARDGEFSKCCTLSCIRWLHCSDGSTPFELSIYHPWLADNLQYILAKVRNCSSWKYFFLSKQTAEIAWRNRPVSLAQWKEFSLFCLKFNDLKRRNKTFSSISLLIHQSPVDGHFHESNMKCAHHNRMARMQNVEMKEKEEMQPPTEHYMLLNIHRWIGDGGCKAFYYR